MKWTVILSLSGLLIPYLWSLLKEYVFSGETYKFVDGYIVALAFLSGDTLDYFGRTEDRFLRLLW